MTQSILKACRSVAVRSALTRNVIAAAVVLFLLSLSGSVESCFGQPPVVYVPAPLAYVPAVPVYRVPPPIYYVRPVLTVPAGSTVVHVRTGLFFPRWRSTVYVPPMVAAPAAPQQQSAAGAGQ